MLSAATNHLLQVGSKGAEGSELQTLCGSPGSAWQARRGRRSSDLPPPRSRRLTEGPGNVCPAGVLVPRVSGTSQLIPQAGALGHPCLAPFWPRDPVPRGRSFTFTFTAQHHVLAPLCSWFPRILLLTRSHSSIHGPRGLRGLQSDHSRLFHPGSNCAGGLGEGWTVRLRPGSGAPSSDPPGVPDLTPHCHTHVHSCPIRWGDLASRVALACPRTCSEGKGYLPRELEAPPSVTPAAVSRAVIPGSLRDMYLRPRCPGYFKCGPTFPGSVGSAFSSF